MKLQWMPPQPSPQPDGDSRELSIVELHIRSVEKLGPDWYCWCSCGYVSTSCLTADEAHQRPCEVEQILAESDYRERQLFARWHDGH